MLIVLICQQKLLTKCNVVCLAIAWGREVGTKLSLPPRVILELSNLLNIPLPSYSAPNS